MKRLLKLIIALQIMCASALAVSLVAILIIVCGGPTLHKSHHYHHHGRPTACSPEIVTVGCNAA